MKTSKAWIITGRFAIFFLMALPGINIFAQEVLPDTLKLEEVLISGNRVDVARKNVPLTVSSVSREVIEQSGESALLPVLDGRVPGFFVTERGITGFGVSTGAAGEISIRGIGGSPNNEILVLIDGHPQYQGIFGHPLPDAYVTSDVEKVEVVRGPASLLYGSNAMGGVINIITKEQQNEGFSGNARVSYGSFNTQKYMVNAGFKKNKLSIFASINHNSTDGHRDSSGFKITNGFVKGGYEINAHFSVSADFNLASFTADDPGSIYDPALFSIDITRGKTSLSVMNKYEKTEGALIGYYNFGEHNLSDGFHSTDANAGLSLYQGMRFFKGNLLTAGFDYKEFGGKANSGAAANKWNSMTEVAGYAYMQQTMLEKLVLSAGLRVENNNLTGTEIIPQGGFSWHVLTGTDIRGSISKGYRSPTIMETYLFLPNPDLKPENLMNYEISLEQNLIKNKLSIDLTTFWIEGDNIILVVPNTTPPPPVKRENSGKLSHRGIEIEASWHINEQFALSASHSYLHMRDPRLAAPKNMNYIQLSWHKDKLTGNLSLSSINDLYVALATETADAVMADYQLLNAGISYAPVKWLSLFLNGKNLLNQDYQINYGYPMPGISFMGGINVKF